MTLQELRRDFERRAADAHAVGATAPLGAVYEAVLSELDAIDGHPRADDGFDGGPSGDRLLNVREAAERLGVAPRWVYRHAARLPFMRRLSPKVLRASEAGLERYLAKRS